MRTAVKEQLHALARSAGTTWGTNDADLDIDYDAAGALETAALFDHWAPIGGKDARERGSEEVFAEAYREAYSARARARAMQASEAPSAEEEMTDGKEA